MNDAHIRTKIAVLAIALLTLGFSAASATPTDSDDEVEVEVKHRINIKHKVHCEGDDCSDEASERTLIFIDEDGDEQVLDGDHEWIGADGGHMMKIMMHGGGQKGGFLGVGLTELTPELRTHFGVPEKTGVMVSKVVDDSAAQRAGIQVGDIITLVDSEDVASGGALSHAIGSHEGGDSVTLEIWRDGSVQRLTATLGENKGTRMKMMPRIHLKHSESGEHAVKRIEIRCEDGDENCAEGMGDYDCGSEECEVRVECSDGGCSCTVNGETADCGDIPGVPHQ